MTVHDDIPPPTDADHPGEWDAGPTWRALLDVYHVATDDYERDPHPAGYDTTPHPNGNGHHPADKPDPPIELDAFLNTPEPAYDWLIEGLLERTDRVILTAGEGGGKSTLLRQFGLMAASGIHPFSLEPIDPITVLLVDLENSTRHIRRKMADLRAATELYQPPRFLIESRPEGCDLAKLPDTVWLEERCATSRADLLLIGPIYKMGSGDPTREEEARHIAGAIDTIRTILNITVLIEAHTPYADGAKGSKRPERPYGASLWSRWPEYGIYLAPEGDLRHWRGQRDERAWPTKLERGTPWPWMVTEAAEEPWSGPTHCMDAVLQAITRIGGQVTTNTMVTNLREHGSGFRRETVLEALNLLADKGELEARDGPRGSRLYHLPGSNPTLHDPNVPF